MAQTIRRTIENLGNALVIYVMQRKTYRRHIAAVLALARQAESGHVDMEQLGPLLGLTPRWDRKYPMLTAVLTYLERHLLIVHYQAQCLDPDLPHCTAPHDYWCAADRLEYPGLSPAPETCPPGAEMSAATP
jgi:hypothetical protein